MTAPNDEWPEYLHLVEVTETVTYLVEYRTETTDPDEAVAELDDYGELHEYRHHSLVVDATIEAQHPFGRPLCPDHPVMRARLLRFMGAWREGDNRCR